MENQEQSKQERNLKEDHHAFIEALSSASIEEIPTVFDEEAFKSLADNIQTNKLFMLGEIHGVKENADIIYTLFKKFGFRNLALEWSPELKEVAEKFIERGELDFEAMQDEADGRITAGHFALLKKLRSEGMLEKFVCFDSGSLGGGWSARDAAMFQNILSNLSETPTLVVAGNLHTKTKSITFKDEPGEQHPMGENITKEIPDVASGRVEYLRGQYHNFGTQDFSELPEEETTQGGRFYLREDGLYIFELSEAHVATVPNPHEKV